MDVRKAVCHDHAMRRGVAQLLFAVVYVACYGLGIWLIIEHAPAHTTAVGKAAAAMLVLAAYAVGIIMHELGHALAARLAGARVLSIHFFGPPDRLTFHVGTTAVSLGLRPSGQVVYPARQLSVARDGLVTVAGPATEILVAPLWLLLPVSRWLAVFLAFISLTSGLRDFAPGTDEYESDGYQLFRLRARLRADRDISELLAIPDWIAVPDAADRLIKGYSLDIPQAVDRVRELRAQPDLLLRLYAQPWTLARRPEPDVQKVIHGLSWQVLLNPDVPVDLADLAADRVEWVRNSIDPFDDDAKVRRADVTHTLALARLRQGRPEEVRALCGDALARDDLDPADRATVLATVALARHARMLSGEKQLDEALALNPDADLVAEAVALLRGSRADTGEVSDPRPVPPSDDTPEVALKVG